MHKSVDDVVSDSDLGLVIRSLEDLDQEKTPVNEEKIPVDEEKIPVDEEKIPVDEEKIPVDEEKIPVDEEKTPVDEEKTPVDEEKTPVDEEKTPVDEEKIPVNEEKTPVDEEKTPVNEEKNPVDEEKTPVDEEKTPVNEEKNPVNEEKTPVDEEKIPVDEEKTPVDEEKTPVDEEKTPVDEEKTPVHTAMGLNIVGDTSLEKVPHKNRAQNAQTVDLKKFGNDRAAYGMKAATRRDMSGPLQSPVLFGLSCVNFRNFLFLYVLLSSLLSAQGTQLIKPKQPLPGKCFKLIEDKGGDCPSVDHLDFQERYEELNSTCCAEFKEKVVHCQMDYDKKGKQYSQIACMEPVPVPPGFSGRFVHYDTDTPMFRLTRFNDTHRPEAERMSYEVTYPYGTIEKSKCTGFGQERLCIGVDDNLCTCQEGFEPKGNGCEAGFSADAPCYCQEMTCPVGSHPKRSAEQGLGDVDCSEFDPSSLNFSCEADPPSETTANMPLGNTTPSPSSTFSPDVTTKPDENTTKIKSESQWYHILLAILVFAVACGTIFVAVWFLSRRKETRSEDRRRLRESQIGGRGSDAELGLENPAQD